MNFETNLKSLEGPNIELFESEKGLSVASSWGAQRPSNGKSTTFTKSYLEPSIIEILPISKLVSFIISKSFLLKCITLFKVNWLRNGKSTKFEVRIIMI